MATGGADGWQGKLALERHLTAQLQPGYLQAGGNASAHSTAQHAQRQPRQAEAERRTGSDSAGLGAFSAKSTSIANDHLHNATRGGSTAVGAGGGEQGPRGGGRGRAHSGMPASRSLVPAVPVGRVQRDVEVALDPGGLHRQGTRALWHWDQCTMEARLEAQQVLWARALAAECHE